MRLKQGYLVILSAPSGTGKTTICKKLLEINKDWTYSISATTREKRDSEKEGVDYFFMSKEKFDYHFTNDNLEKVVSDIDKTIKRKIK